MRRIQLSKVFVALICFSSLLSFKGYTQTTTFNYTGSLQNYTVPPNVYGIRIETYGAQGGSSTYTGSLGAKMTGDFAVTPGDQLIILVGGKGQDHGSQPGGGGGTFVVKTETVSPYQMANGTYVTPWIIAGGGGGAWTAGPGNVNFSYGSVGGTGGTCMYNTYITNGGTNGNGGETVHAGGGGGFLTDATQLSVISNTVLTGGRSFLNLGAGGNQLSGGLGGYGGGGGGHAGVNGPGGGGGYSGGGGGMLSNGGGGGSYNIGSNQVNQDGFRIGDGLVVITVTVTCTPTASTLNETACDSYTLNAQSYTSTGTYTQTIPNAAGCDSTITLNLTINNSNSGSETVVACDTYTWSANGTTYNASGTYTALLSNANGCDSLATLQLTINPLPAIDAGTDLTGCEGDQFMITVTGDPASYSISPNAPYGQLFTPPVGTNTYTVTALDNNQCSNSDQVTFIVNPLPTIFAGDDQLVCEGDPITLSGSGGDSYIWDNNVTDGNPFIPGHLGDMTFTVTGTDGNGCNNSDQVVVTVNEHTFATQTEGAIDSYTWPVNGQTYTQSGTYSATIPNSLGCDSVITLNLTLEFTGINAMEAGEFMIYPNPANQEIHLITSLPANEEFAILDGRGTVVLKGTLTQTDTFISLKDLSAGTYFLRVGNNKPPIKVVKI